MVKGDLLGDAFGVSAFHRCQVNNLLRGQIIPYNTDNNHEKDEVVALENIAGMAAGTGNITLSRSIVSSREDVINEVLQHKRSRSDDDDDDSQSKKIKTELDGTRDEIVEEDTEFESEEFEEDTEFEPEEFELKYRPEEVNISFDNLRITNFEGRRENKRQK